MLYHKSVIENVSKNTVFTVFQNDGVITAVPCHELKSNMRRSMGDAQ